MDLSAVIWQQAISMEVHTTERDPAKPRRRLATARKLPQFPVLTARPVAAEVAPKPVRNIPFPFFPVPVSFKIVAGRTLRKYCSGGDHAKSGLLNNSPAS